MMTFILVLIGIVGILVIIFCWSACVLAARVDRMTEEYFRNLQDGNSDGIQTDG